MRLVAIRRFYLNDSNVVKQGEAVEVADKTGRELIAAGKAQAIDKPAEPKPASKPPGSNAMTTQSAAGLVPGAKKEKAT
jgi:hypothetical protein